MYAIQEDLFYLAADSAALSRDFLKENGFTHVICIGDSFHYDGANELGGIQYIYKYAKDDVTHEELYNIIKTVIYPVIAGMGWGWSARQAKKVLVCDMDLAGGPLQSALVIGYLMDREVISARHALWSLTARFPVRLGTHLLKQLRAIETQILQKPDSLAIYETIQEDSCLGTELGNLGMVHTLMAWAELGGRVKEEVKEEMEGRT
ncbi:hypothetical protein QBC47DRAFT_403318 [Echria macrotheca]|uniref:Uncharacterized protein n=1 Tax=Echria macrotheca TaxID=438768 RepID=A0AAJ0B910_9PEZI|nr:hypothetical protein QBC47DRAFT_403318 [Echria macrotheca]